MGYSAIKIPEIGQNVDPFVDAATDSAGNLIEEPYDHGLRHKVTATRLQILRRAAGASEFEMLLFVPEIELEVYITDSRVAYRCLKYDKGDRKWSGGLTALALNAYERAKADRRSAGTVLLGHIRYEWLREIQYSDYHKQKWYESNDFRIRLIYKDADQATWVVETCFGNEIDTAFLANEILHRAARYRLAMTDEKQEKLIEYTKKCLNTTIPRSDNPKEKYSSCSLMYSYFAPGGEEYRPPLDGAANTRTAASVVPAPAAPEELPAEAQPEPTQEPVEAESPAVAEPPAEAQPEPTQEPAGWTCPNCGRELAAAARFCIICGQPRPEPEPEPEPEPVPEPQPEPAQWICPNCGRRSDMDARFCLVCGQPRPEPEPEPVLEPEPQPEPIPEPEPAPAQSDEPAGWKCPQCGTVSDADNLFCYVCGQRRPEPKPEPEPAQEPAGWKCPQCGTVSDADDLFCYVCGQRRPEPAQPKEPAGWTCPRCGTVCGADDRFCYVCGQPRSQA